MRAATFTTYINAELDPGLEAAYARQTAVAKSSYASIAEAAQQATRATAGLLGGSGTAGIAQGNSAIQARTAATRALTSASADAERQAGRAAVATNTEAAAASRSTLANTALARSLNTTAVSLSVVEGRMSPLAGRFVTLARATETLTGPLLGIAGAAAGVYALAKAGNEYTVLESRIRPFFNTQTQANRAMSDIVGIATRSRASLESVVEVYQRLTSQSGQLGVSQEQIARATEIASKAATLSGGTQEARSGALVQFSQALGANFRGSGQEFQSLAEGAPQLLSAIAAGFKNANGSIGTTVANLRKLAQQGELTSQQVLDALDRSAIDIDRKFGRLPVTLNQAGTEFKNALVVYVGQVDHALGLTSDLAFLVEGVANNLRTVAALAVGVAGAFAAIKLTSYAKTAADNVNGIISQRVQLKQLDAAWVEDAEISTRAYAARLTELEEERVAAGQALLAIEQRAKADQEASAARIASIQRETAAVVAGYEEQARAAAAVAAEAKANGGVAITGTQVVRGRSYPTTTSYETAKGQVGGALDAAAGAEAAGQAQLIEAEASAAAKAEANEAALGAARQKLNGTLRETEATVGALGTAEATLATRTEAVAARTTLFGGAMETLLGVFDPVALLIGGVVTALYLLATAESSAEKATRSHEDAQRTFQTIIDRTTGKIYGQVDALQKLDAQRKASADLGLQVGQAKSAQTDIVDQLKRFTAPVDPRAYAALAAQNVNPVTGRIDPDVASSLLDQSRVASNNPAAQQLARALSDFQNNVPGSLSRLASTVNSLKDVIPGLKDAIPALSKADQQFRDAAGNIKQTRAGQRIIAGQAQAGDLALVYGQQAGGVQGPTKPLSKAQIQANAEAEAAQTDVQRARANLEQIKAAGQQPGESDIDYQHRLAGAIQQVNAAIQAQKDARHQATEAAAAQRKEESNEKTEALQAATAKKDSALADLYSQGLNPQSEAYKKQRDAILDTYDEEVAKIKGLKNEHTALAAAAEADAKATAAYVQKMGDTRQGILERYKDQPRAVDTAIKNAGQLQEAVGTTFNGVLPKTIDNPLGKGLYTQDMADADKAHILTGLYKPLRDVEQESQRSVEIARLQLAGRDDEAAALQKVYRLTDAGLDINKEQFAQLVQNEQQEQRINDALQSRQRIVSLLQGSVDDARSATEKFFSDLSSGNAGNAFGNLLKNFQQRFSQINAQQLTERLFAGADDKVRQLIQGTSGVDSATANYVESLGKTKDSSASLATAFGSLQDRVDKTLTGDTLGGTSVGSSIANNTGLGSDISSLFGSDTDAFSQLAKAGAAAAVAGAGAAAATGSQVNGQSIATTTQQTLQVAQAALKSTRTPSATSVYNELGKAVGTNLDKLVDSVFGKKKDTSGALSDDGTGLGSDTAAFGNQTGSTFFKKLGDTFGTALKGANTGAEIQSALAPIGKALGIKTSKTGAEVGGTIGSLSGIPGGDIIGSIVGSVIGGLFKKTPKSSATLALNDAGELVVGTVTGSSASRQKTATGEATTLIDSLNQIADTLGGTVSGAGSVSIGTRNKKYVVDTSGQGRTKGSGTEKFDDEQDAITAAISDALSDGVIAGISDASKKILASGQDLSTAIQKASVIESIPKQLEQIQDPVRYAVDTLNDSFAKMITYLKEGGATAQQYSQAQQLYDLQRTQAIQQAQDSISSAIDDFLQQMTSSSSSVFSKTDTYANASTALDSFRGDITSGKAVDQNALVTAAQNFEDASRSLYGSTSGFFSDFGDLKNLLTQAKANAGDQGTTDLSTLPASPFDTDSTVQSALASLQGATTTATQAQTTTLASKLDTLTNAVLSLAPGSGVASGGRSAVTLLPGFAKQ
jgi:tape measure domain-containing protein